LTISIEDLKRDMRQVNNQNTNSTFSHGKNKELVLSAVQGRGKPRFKKVFKGDCRICGKKGHKAADCWESIETKTSALPIISLMKVKLINLMIRKRYIAPIVTKMVTPWIAVSERSAMKRKMTNRVMTIQS
jgi:hypothetical protein